MKWNHRALEALTVERETEYPYGGVEGLRLRVYPTGRKVWVWRRMIFGERSKQTIGRFPAVTMTDAVSRASEFNIRVEAGLPAVDEPEPVYIDPRMTVREGWKRYIDDCERRGGRTYLATDAMGQKDFVEHLGGCYIADITSDDIRDCVARPMNRGRKAKGDFARTGGSTQSNTLLSVLRTFFKFSIDNQYDVVVRNPAAAVRKVPVLGKRKKRVLTLREMALLIMAAREFDRENAARTSGRGKNQPTTWADVVTILVMVGNRKGEVYGALGDEWDDREKVWRIGAERYKTSVDAVLPVGPTVAAIFERRARAGEFLIPSQRGIRTQCDRPIVARLTELMEEIGGEPVEKWTMHSTRYGFRAGIRKAKIADSELAEKIIHPKRASGAVDYDPEWEEEKREALAQWDVLVNAEIAKISAARLSMAA